MNLWPGTGEMERSWHYSGVTSIAGSVDVAGDLGEVPAESAASRAAAPPLREAFARDAHALYAFILARTGGDRDAADEILQECCFHAARSRRLPSDPQKLSAWFRGIARNLVHRHWRKQRLWRRQCSTDHPDGFAALASRLTTERLPDEALESRELRQVLAAALHRLGRSDRELLFAFYFDDRPVNHIAAETRTTPRSVEGRLHRARERLRALLHHASSSGET
jgi:RNA polymerase sigma factor (sigma-70 family)